MSDSLVQLAVQSTQIFLHIIIMSGIIGISLNIIILIRSALNKYSCTHYFLALSCNNLCYVILFLTHRLLADGYQLNPETHFIFLCKVIEYTSNVSIGVSPQLIAQASIDRFFVASLVIDYEHSAVFL